MLRCELPDPSLPVVTAPTPCALYQIDLKDALFVINGWAVDALAGDAAGGVTVVIDGKPHPAFYGLRRDDVAKALGNRKFNCSGFRCPVPAKSIGPGKHSLVIKVQSRDRTAVFEVSEEIEFNGSYASVVKPAGDRL